MRFFKLKLTPKMKIRVSLSIFITLILSILLIQKCSNRTDHDIKKSGINKKDKIDSLSTNNLKVTATTKAGTPLLGVRLSLIGPSHKILPAVSVTEKNGVVVFTKLKAGKYKLSTQDNRFSDFSLLINFPVVKAVVIKLEKKSLIKGIVIDEQGNPVENVNLTLISRDTQNETKTVSRKSGEFELYGIGGKFYSLSGSKAGFDSDNTMVVTPRKARIKFVINHLSKVTIEVLDDKGNPLSNASVVIAGPNLWPPFFEKTDDKGRVTIKNIKAGIFGISAWKDSMVADMDGLELESGKSTMIHLYLKKGVFLRGLVRDNRSGKPVEGALLTIGNSQPSLIIKQIISDETGKFRIGPFTPGEYRFSLSAPGYVTLSGKRYWITTEKELALFDLTKGVTIKGRVIDDLANPQKGAVVEIWGMSYSGGLISPVALAGPGFSVSGELGIINRKTTIGLMAQGKVLTGENGKFELNGIPEGWLALRIIHENHIPAYYLLGEVTKNRSSIEIRLKPGIKMEGFIKDDIGSPLAGVEIRISSPVEPAYSFTTYSDPSGKFKITGAPSIISLSYHHPEFAIKEETIKITPRHTVSLSKGMQQITLLIRDKAGFNIKKAGVELISKSRQEIHLGTTDNYGICKFKTLGTGEYYAVITHKKYPEFKTETLHSGDNQLILPYGNGLKLFIRDKDVKNGLNAKVTMIYSDGTIKYRTAHNGELIAKNLKSGKWKFKVSLHHYVTLWKTISVSTGEKLNDFDPHEKIWELVRAGSISGKVRDSKGLPVKYARVIFGDRIVKTNGYGKFYFRDLPPGNIELTAWHSKYGVGKTKVNVMHDMDTSDVYIDLETNIEDKTLFSGITLGKESSTGKTVIKIIDKDSAASGYNLSPGEEVLYINGLSSGISLFFLQSQLEGKKGETIFLQLGTDGIIFKNILITL